jgi:hypothetical protein
MTKLLERAIEAARALPAEMQDELARMMLHVAAGDDDIQDLSPEEKESFARSLDQASKGIFASDEDVRSVFDRYSR